MKNNRTARFIAAALTAMMLLAMVPVTVFAYEDYGSVQIMPSLHGGVEFYGNAGDEGEFRYDQDIALIVTPDTGYRLKSLYFTASTEQHDITGPAEDQRYHFAMLNPPEELKVYATFEEIPYTLKTDADIANGSAAFTNSSGQTITTATYGQTVYVAFTPEEGYELDTGSVKAAVEEGAAPSLAATDEENKYSLSMPASNLTVSAVFKKHEHALEHTAAVPAGCDKAGNIEYWYCAKCGEYFSDAAAETTVSKDDLVTAATGHDWGKWTVSKKATCSAKGEEERICNNDPSHKETRPVDADPDAHDWGEWKVTKKATEKAEGEETRTCKNDPSHKETRSIPKLIVYSGKAGAASWTKGTKTDLTFTFKRSEKDKETFGRFKGITVDGKAVDKANYTAKAGSVVINLKAAYLEKLSVGKHTLEAQFDDGKSSVSFTVAAAKAETKKPTNSAPTGDGSGTVFFSMLMAAALLGLILAGTRASKRR